MQTTPLFDFFLFQNFLESIVYRHLYLQTMGCPITCSVASTTEARRSSWTSSVIVLTDTRFLCTRSLTRKLNRKQDTTLKPRSEQNLTQNSYLTFGNPKGSHQWRQIGSHHFVPYILIYTN